MTQSKKNSFFSLSTSRRWLAIAVMAAILVFGGLALAIHSKTKKSVSTIPSTSPPQSTSSAGHNNGASPSSAADNSSAGPQTQASSDKASQSSSGAVLIKPSGQFVSSHHLSVSADDTEESVCNTTPGATCYIKFTKGGDTRQLESKQADSNGSVYWRWSVTTAGLSQGSWTITAAASLSGQSLSTQDVDPLQVQP